MLCMEVCPCNYFWWCGYFWSPCVSIVLTDEFSVRVTKITSRISVSDVSDFGHFLLKGCKPDNLESYNSWKLSLTNIWDLCLNFMECESFLETLLTFLLYVRQTWMTQLIQVILLWNFTFTYMHGLAVYANERIPFTQGLSIQNCKFLFMFSTGFTSFSDLVLFPVLKPSSSCTVCDVFNLRQMKFS